MKLNILGTVGYHPTDKRETVSAIIPELGFILDAGTSAYRIPDLIETKNLCIFITHLHFDHTIGLTYLTDILANKNIESLKIFGPPNIDLAVKTMFGTDFFPVPLPRFAEVMVAPNEFELLGVKVRTMPLVHKGPTIGYRFSFGEFDLSYITDTVVDKSYFPLARDTDLLIHECNFPSDMKETADLTRHTETSSFLQMLDVTLAKRAVATHLNAFDEAANERIAGELLNANSDTIIAEDGMVITLERDNVRVVDN